MRLPIQTQQYSTWNTIAKEIEPKRRTKFELSGLGDICIKEQTSKDEHPFEVNNNERNKAKQIIVSKRQQPILSKPKQLDLSIPRECYVSSAMTIEELRHEYLYRHPTKKRIARGKWKHWFLFQLGEESLCIAPPLESSGSPTASISCTVSSSSGYSDTSSTANIIATKGNESTFSKYCLSNVSKDHSMTKKNDFNKLTATAVEKSAVAMLTDRPKIMAKNEMLKRWKETKMTTNGDTDTDAGTTSTNVTTTIGLKQKKQVSVKEQATSQQPTPSKVGPSSIPTNQNKLTTSLRSTRKSTYKQRRLSSYDLHTSMSKQMSAPTQKHSSIEKMTPRPITVNAKSVNNETRTDGKILPLKKESKVNSDSANCLQKATPEKKVAMMNKKRIKLSRLGRKSLSSKMEPSLQPACHFPRQEKATVGNKLTVTQTTSKISRLSRHSLPGRRLPQDPLLVVASPKLEMAPSKATAKNKSDLKVTQKKTSPNAKNKCATFNQPSQAEPLPVLSKAYQSKMSAERMGQMRQSRRMSRQSIG